MLSAGNGRLPGLPVMRFSSVGLGGLPAVMAQNLQG